MKVLVVGGAGYIGSHMTVMLSEKGHDVVVLDDLSSGRKEAVIGARLVIGTIADEKLLDDVLAGQCFDAVMHFASFIQVGESMREPAKYYRNNVVNTLNLLDAMMRHRVHRFIFSSSAAIFGNPDRVPLHERSAPHPINPYGRTKLIMEQALHDYEAAYGVRSVCLRYFNAAGADPAGRLGETHEPESHLIPLVLQTASGRRDAIRLFGRDYDTPDGTCIRDYIHVVDLCAAHLRALERLRDGAPSAAYNLGNGNGFSVQEVIDAARRVTGREIPIIEAPRRMGDPPRLVADPRCARIELGWSPAYPELQTIMTHAWAWERKK